MDGTKGFPGSLGTQRISPASGAPGPAARPSRRCLQQRRAHLRASHRRGAWRLPVLCRAAPCGTGAARRAVLGPPTVLSSLVSATSPDPSPVPSRAEVGSTRLPTAPAC